MGLVKAARSWMLILLRLKELPLRSAGQRLLGLCVAFGKDVVVLLAGLLVAVGLREIGEDVVLGGALVPIAVAVVGGRAGGEGFVDLGVTVVVDGGEGAVDSLGEGGGDKRIATACGLKGVAKDVAIVVGVDAN